jgi:DNA-entry nuclease
LDTHHRGRHHKKRKIYFTSVLFAGLLGISVSLGMNSSQTQKPNEPQEASDTVHIEVETVNDISAKIKYSLENLPEYSGEAYVELNGNVPAFTEEEKNITESFEYYSPLDELGRCGEAYANICDEIRPTEERGEIGSIRPSGWHTVKYSGIIEGNYLYNRCHLIGYQLSGENDNELNLITGTRYLNISGMLPFENMVDDYLDRTDNHVLYRVTPIFEGENLVASGVVMEAWSVEDGGEGICFNVYCYNVQPGVEIDYLTGDSRLSGE